MCQHQSDALLQQNWANISPMLSTSGWCWPSSGVFRHVSVVSIRQLEKSTSWLNQKLSQNSQWKCMRSQVKKKKEDSYKKLQKIFQTINRDIIFTACFNSTLNRYNGYIRMSRHREDCQISKQSNTTNSAYSTYYRDQLVMTAATPSIIVEKPADRCK